MATLLQRLVHLAFALLLSVVAAVFGAGAWMARVDSRLATMETAVDDVKELVLRDLNGRVRELERKVHRDILPEAETRLDTLERQVSDDRARLQVLEAEVGR